MVGILGFQLQCKGFMKRLMDHFNGVGISSAASRLRFHG